MSSALLNSLKIVLQLDHKEAYVMGGLWNKPLNVFSWQNIRYNRTEKDSWDDHSLLTVSH